jgi:heat shock transcription factor
MPPSNPRKRAAPGSSPVQTPQMQQYPATSQLSNAEFLRWSGGPDAQNYPEAGTFNMNSYADVAGMSQPQYEPSVPAPSTQLARRPVNRQLVQTAQRTTFDNTTDPWGQFGDDSILDPQNAIMEESDSIELLEEKAAVAKKDAQSKRKQIPPFVQKLSR